MDQSEVNRLFGFMQDHKSDLLIINTTSNFRVWGWYGYADDAEVFLSGADNEPVEWRNIKSISARDRNGTTVTA